MILEDVCELIVDCPHSTAKNEGEGFPLIRTPNIGKGRLLLTNVHRVSKEVYEKRNLRATPQTDDIIFAREAPAGNAALITEGQKVCLGQRTVLIRPNLEKVYPKYLVYYILAPQQQYKLLGTANGATVAHVNLPVIRKMNIELPEMDVQVKIADIISAYDDLLENNQEQIKLLEEGAQRLYKEWFVNLHFPGSEYVNIIDGIPDGWIKCVAGDVIEFNPKMKLTKGKMKQFVPMSALSTNSMQLDNSELTMTESNSGAKFCNGDTLLARITPCLENGKTAYVSGIKTEEGAVGSTEFIVMRSKKINSYMVYLFARTREFRQFAINTMTGSDGRQRAQVDKISLYPYLLAPQEIIDAFEKMVKPMFDQIHKKNMQNEKLSQARDRLIPKLMNGEIEL